MLRRLGGLRYHGVRKEFGENRQSGSKAESGTYTLASVLNLVKIGKVIQKLRLEHTHTQTISFA
jgi:hypothetical protein